jgi:hypothetical protein
VERVLAHVRTSAVGRRCPILATGIEGRPRFLRASTDELRSGIDDSTLALRLDERLEELSESD